MGTVDVELSMGLLMLVPIFLDTSSTSVAGFRRIGGDGAVGVDTGDRTVGVEGGTGLAVGDLVVPWTGAIDTVMKVDTLSVRGSSSPAVPRVALLPGALTSVANNMKC